MPADPFDPPGFRALGHQLIDLLADHLQTVADRRVPVLHWQEPEAALASVPPLGTGGGADPIAFVRELCERSNRLHHPRFVGHQVSAPLPLAVLFDTAIGLLNNGMAVYETGPLTTMLEQRALQWLAARLGLPTGADGVMTSGGSLGNLTALLAARQLRLPRDAWQHGPGTGTIFVSAQAHYCIDRAARILGLGADGCVLVPVDARFRMQPDALRAAIARTRQAGRLPFAVVASACTTATGTFDPLADLADICQQERLWLHVDAAHGAPFALLPRMRSLLRGLERADSIVCDAHKMLQMPALSTAVLFADGRHSHATFQQQASYLFANARDDEWFNRGRRTFECTKRGAGAVLYGCLAVLGEQPFVQALEHSLLLADHLATALRRAPDFELAVEPDCNIVCFRHRPSPGQDPDDHNRRIRARLRRTGAFYVVQTTLPTGLYLRCTLINPRTTTQDLDAMLDAIRAAAGASE